MAGLNGRVGCMASPGCCYSTLDYYFWKEQRSTPNFRAHRFTKWPPAFSWKATGSCAVDKFIIRLILTDSKLRSIIN